MVDQRLLMPEDMVHVLSSARRHWDYLQESGGK